MQQESEPKQRERVNESLGKGKSVALMATGFACSQTVTGNGSRLKSSKEGRGGIRLLSLLLQSGAPQPKKQPVTPWNLEVRRRARLILECSPLLDAVSVEDTVARHEDGRAWGFGDTLYWQYNRPKYLPILIWGFLITIIVLGLATLPKRARQ